MKAVSPECQKYKLPPEINKPAPGARFAQIERGTMTQYAHHQLTIRNDKTGQIKTYSVVRPAFYPRYLECKAMPPVDDEQIGIGYWLAITPGAPTVTFFDVGAANVMWREVAASIVGEK